MPYFAAAARSSSGYLARRVARSIPYLGAAVVVVTLGATMRRKGVVGGLAHAGLDAIPFVGAGKNLIEWFRGEDFFPDQPISRNAR
jgi:hypothetical protein